MGANRISMGMNELALVWMRAMLDAWRDDPPKLVLSASMTTALCTLLREGAHVVRYTTRREDAAYLAARMADATRRWAPGDACRTYRGDANTTVARVEGSIVYLENGDSMHSIQDAGPGMTSGLAASLSAHIAAARETAEALQAHLVAGRSHRSRGGRAPRARARRSDRVPGVAARSRADGAARGRDRRRGGALMSARDDVADLVERHLEAGTDVTELVASLMHAAANLTVAMLGGGEGMSARVGDAALDAMRAEATRKVGAA